MSAYNPTCHALFMPSAPPAERLFRARQVAGLLSDQFALLRTLGGNVNEALTRGPVSLDERKRIAGLLDECIGEMGKLIGNLNGSAI